MAFVDEAFGIACGVMGWPPSHFWQATPHEFLWAWKGYKRFHGYETEQGLCSDDVMKLRETLNKTLESQNHVL